jgi:hypothetical protein
MRLEYPCRTHLFRGLDLNSSQELLASLVPPLCGYRHREMDGNECDDTATGSKNCNELLSVRLKLLPMGEKFEMEE